MMMVILVFLFYQEIVKMEMAQKDPHLILIKFPKNFGTVNSNKPATNYLQRLWKNIKDAFCVIEIK